MAWCLRLTSAQRPFHDLLALDTEPKTDFFISDTQPDRRWAEWIAWALNEAGYTAAIHAWHFRPTGRLSAMVYVDLVGLDTEGYCHAAP